VFNHQFTDQTPPVPTRGAADGDEEQKEQGAEEVNVVDLLPRTNINGSKTETIISELNDKNWKVLMLFHKYHQHQFFSHKCCSFCL